MSVKRDNREDQSQSENVVTRVLFILKTNRGRVLVPFFLIYLYNLVRVGSAGGWSFERGFEWPTPGFQLFPIPMNPIDWAEFGIGFPQVVVPMGIADIILYVVFVANGIWLIWTVLSIAYFFLPSISWIRNRFSLKKSI
ncbi:MAG: hypothetical protein ACXABZ_12995 [Candidatus Thorarchaeota archaeon]